MTAKVAALAAAALILILAITSPPSRRPQLAERAVVVDTPAAISSQPPARRPPATGPARRALRWQLAAEHGQRRPIPSGVFTDRLAVQLASRPPRPQPARPRAVILRVRELAGRGPRRVVATIKRDIQLQYVNLELACTERCLVASIQ